MNWVYSIVLYALICALFSMRAYAAEVSFKARATPGINISASCEIATAILSKDKLSLIATVDLTTCDTGNSLRNKHMKQDLEADKHPVARLEAKLGNNSFIGKLFIHGVTKQVSGKVEGNELSFSIKMSDYLVNRRSYLGVGVQDEVHITGRY
jgi:polyisoprenoid-binding protein YceI